MRILIAVLLITLLVACKSEEEKEIENAIKSYKILEKNNNYLEMCTMASAIAFSYLSIHKEEEYGLWKETEKRDCKIAGEEFGKSLFSF